MTIGDVLLILAVVSFIGGVIALQRENDEDVEMFLRLKNALKKEEENGDNT